MANNPFQDELDVLASSLQTNAQNRLQDQVGNTVDYLGKLSGLSSKYTNKLNTVNSNTPASTAALKPDTLVGLLDGDTLLTQNYGNRKIRDIDSSNSYIDAVDTNILNDNYLDNGGNPVKKERQLDWAADALTTFTGEMHNPEDVTQQDLVDLSNMAVKQRLVDMSSAKGEERYIEEFMPNSGDKINVSGSYKDEFGSDINIPLDIPINIQAIKSLDGKGGGGRLGASIYSEGGIDTTALLKNTPSMNTASDMSKYIPESVYQQEAFEQRTFADKLTNSLAALGATFSQPFAGVGNMVAGWLGADNASAEDIEQKVNEAFGHDTYALQYAEEEAGEIFNDIKTNGFKLRHIGQLFGIAYAVPEVLASSIAFVGSMALPGAAATKGLTLVSSSMKNLANARKVISDVPSKLARAKQLGKADEVAKLQKSLDDAKAVVDGTSTSMKAANFVASELGTVINTASMTNADIEAYAKEAGIAKEDVTFDKIVGAAAANALLVKLDYIIDTGMLKSAANISGMISVLKGASTNQLKKLALQTSKYALANTSNLAKEGVTEYAQQFLTQINQQYGEQTGKSLADVWSNSDNAEERGAAGLLGVVGGSQATAIGSTPAVGGAAVAATRMTIDSVFGRKKATNAEYNESFKAVQDIVDNDQFTPDNIDTIVNNLKTSTEGTAVDNNLPLSQRIALVGINAINKSVADLNNAELLFNEIKATGEIDSEAEAAITKASEKLTETISTLAQMHTRKDIDFNLKDFVNKNVIDELLDEALTDTKQAFSKGKASELASNLDKSSILQQSLENIASGKNVKFPTKLELFARGLKMSLTKGSDYMDAETFNEYQNTLNETLAEVDSTQQKLNEYANELKTIEEVNDDIIDGVFVKVFKNGSRRPIASHKSVRQYRKDLLGDSTSVGLLRNTNTQNKLLGGSYSGTTITTLDDIARFAASRQTKTKKSKSQEFTYYRENLLDTMAEENIAIAELIDDVVLEVNNSAGIAPDIKENYLDVLNTAKEDITKSSDFIAVGKAAISKVREQFKGTSLKELDVQRLGDGDDARIAVVSASSRNGVNGINVYAIVSNAEDRIRFITSSRNKSIFTWVADTAQDKLAKQLTESKAALTKTEQAYLAKYSPNANAKIKILSLKETVKTETSTMKKAEKISTVADTQKLTKSTDISADKEDITTTDGQIVELKPEDSTTTIKVDTNAEMPIEIETPVTSTPEEISDKVRASWTIDKTAPVTGDTNISPTKGVKHHVNKDTPSTSNKKATTSNIPIFREKIAYTVSFLDEATQNTLLALKDWEVRPYLKKRIADTAKAIKTQQETIAQLKEDLKTTAQEEAIKAKTDAEINTYFDSMFSKLREVYEKIRAALVSLVKQTKVDAATQKKLKAVLEQVDKLEQEYLVANSETIGGVNATVLQAKDAAKPLYEGVVAQVMGERMLLTAGDNVKKVRASVAAQLRTAGGLSNRLLANVVSSPLASHAVMDTPKLFAKKSTSGVFDDMTLWRPEATNEDLLKKFPSGFVSVFTRTAESTKELFEDINTLKVLMDNMEVGYVNYVSPKLNNTKAKGDSTVTTTSKVSPDGVLTQVSTTTTKEGVTHTDTFKKLLPLLGTTVSYLAKDGKTKIFENRLPAEMYELAKFYAIQFALSTDSLRIGLANSDIHEIVTDFSVSDAEAEILKNNAIQGYIPWALVKTMTGKSMYNQLGIKPGNNAAIDAKELLIEELGLFIADTAVKNGLVQIGDTVTQGGKSRTFVTTSWEPMVKLFEDNTDLSSLVIEPSKNDALYGHDKEYQEYRRKITILNGIKRAGNKLKYINIDNSRQPATDKPVSVKEDAMYSNSSVQLNQEDKDFIQSQNDTPYVFSTRLNKYMELDRDTALAALGYIDPDTMENTRVYNRKKQIALNSKIEREYDVLKLFYNVYGNNEKFYVPWGETVSGRFTILSDLHYQESKLIREFMIPLENDYEISLKRIKGNEDLELFKVAFAQAMDMDPDKLSEKTTLDAVDKVFSITKEGVVFNVEENDENFGSLVRAFKGIQNNDFTELGLVYDKYEGYHAITAVEALIALDKALKNKETSFRNELHVEADAITSGIILTLMQIGTNKALDLASKGGVYTKETKTKWEAYVKQYLGDAYELSPGALIEAGKVHIKNIETEIASLEDQLSSANKEASKDINSRIDTLRNELASDAVFKDMYATVGMAMLTEVAAISKNTDNLSSEAQALLDSVGKLDFKTLRNIAKPPVMVYNYGASLSSIMKKLGFELGVGTVDTALVNVAKAIKEQKADLDTVIIEDKDRKLLESFGILSLITKDKTKYSQVDGTLLSYSQAKEAGWSDADLLLGLELPIDTVNSIQQAVESTFGTAIKKAFTEVFEEVDNNRDALKTIELMTYEAHAMYKKKELNKLKQAGTYVNQENAASIMAQLEAEGLGHTATIYNTSWKAIKEQPLKGDQFVKAPYSTSLGTDNKNNITSSVKNRTDAAATGGAPTVTIHNLDGTLMRTTLSELKIKGWVSKNVYDAEILPTKSTAFQYGLKLYNKNMVHVATESTILLDNTKKLGNIVKNSSTKDYGTLVQNMSAFVIHQDKNTGTYYANIRQNGYQKEAKRLKLHFHTSLYNLNNAYKYAQERSDILNNTSSLFSGHLHVAKGGVYENKIRKTKLKKIPVADKNRVVQLVKDVHNKNKKLLGGFDYVFTLTNYQYASLENKLKKGKLSDKDAELFLKYKNQTLPSTFVEINGTATEVKGTLLRNTNSSIVSLNSTDQLLQKTDIAVFGNEFYALVENDSSKVDTLLYNTNNTLGILGDKYTSADIINAAKQVIENCKGK